LFFPFHDFCGLCQAPFLLEFYAGEEDMARGARRDLQERFEAQANVFAGKAAARRRR